MNDARSFALNENRAESGSGYSSDRLVFGGVASPGFLLGEGLDCDGLGDGVVGVALGAVGVLGELVSSLGVVDGDGGSSLGEEGDFGCSGADVPGSGLLPSVFGPSDPGI